MLAAGEDSKPNAPGKIAVIQFDPNNVGCRDPRGKIKADVIMSVGPVGSSITADAIAAATRGKEPPTFLEIDASEAIAEREPVYEVDRDQGRRIRRLAAAARGEASRPSKCNHYIVARKTLSEEVVADFTKHLFAIRQTLRPKCPSSAKIEKPDTDKDGPVPVHPGAAAYIDGELKTFFDRYNDLLYWGLMLVSFFGSGLAGSGELHQERRPAYAACRHWSSCSTSSRPRETRKPIQALDELQAEVDKIHGEMIREVESNELDETALMAFQVSFEQAGRRFPTGGPC